MQRLADELEATLRRIGTPKRAAGEKAYMKSDLDFTGTLVSETRAEIREAVEYLPAIDAAALMRAYRERRPVEGADGAYRGTG